MTRTLALFLLLSASAADAAPGQYREWSHSGLLHILTTADGARLEASVVVENFPILVRLNADFFQFDQAAPGGADIRFASSDGKPLSYQIDEWDASNRVASVWVRVPRIRGNTVQAIRMFWGRTGVESESDGAMVFGVKAGFAGVWHLDASLADSTPNKLDGADRGSVAAPGIVGHGRRFGSGSFIHCGEKVDCLPAGNADRSMSAWLNPSSYLFGPTVGGWGKQGAVHLSYMTLSTRGKVKFHGYAADPEGVTTAPYGEWHHALLSITGGIIRFYFDGELEHSTKIRKLDTLSPSACFIGKHTPPGGRWVRHFIGMLDEVRYANVARSAAWAKLCYENQRPLQRLVGPLVAKGAEFSVRPLALTMKEAGRTRLTAVAGGATKLYWVMRRHGGERVVAVDQLHYEFEAGRSVTDDQVTLELRAVYPDGVRIRKARIHIGEAVPDPEFTLPPPARWNGRDRLVIEPQVANQSAMSASGAGKLNYQWSISGPAVLKRIESERLVLERAQRGGTLTVELTIDNGGHRVVRSTKIEVSEPAEDPWVHRTPALDEKPQDHQFYARDRDDRATLHYRGSSTAKGDAVVLTVYADDKLFKREEQQLKADGRYAFAIELRRGLIKYRTVLALQHGADLQVLHTARDLVCGDAYIIQGQSNAEAFDGGRAIHPHKSEWIRSFGTPRTDPKRARSRLWGRASGFERPDGKLQVGYWGIELGKRLVEQHKIPVFLINGAQGGTRIDQHQRNDADPTDVSTIYGRLLWRLEQARLTHGIRGVFWHQGENDQGSAGPGGVWGWQTYERYFVELAESWKRDFPNIENYYVFQIMPKACSMGSAGSDDMLREVQRGLAAGFSNLHLLSTLGIKPPGGCHYPPEGYAKIAERLYPLVARDVHGRTNKGSITPPNLRRASWTSAARTAIALSFDQPVTWDDSLAPRFYLDGQHDLVKTAGVSGSLLTLVLKRRSSAHRLTYLIGSRWNRKDPVLRGANGIAALTFCSVPIEEPPIPIADRNRRGDRLLKAGRFEEAIADFDAYIAAEPRAEPHHWQRGIAYYYAGRYAEGVRQFEMHKKVNPNDVENAVWHFLCKARLDGVAAARKALLPVLPDQRLPMMTVLKLFHGQATTAQVESKAKSASSLQAESALFYAHLYIGLYHEALGNSTAARHHIRLAAETHTSPHYMGDIARMHLKWLGR